MLASFLGLRGLRPRNNVSSITGERETHMRLPAELRVNTLHPNVPRPNGNAVNPDGTLKDASAIGWVHSPSELMPRPGPKKLVLENGDRLDDLLPKRQHVCCSFSFHLRPSLLRPFQLYYDTNDPGANENNNVSPQGPPTTDTDRLISDTSSRDSSKKARHESKAAKSGKGGTAENEESSVGLGLPQPWHEVKSKPFPICDSPLTYFKLPVYPLHSFSSDKGKSLPFPASYPITPNIPPKTVSHNM